MARKNRTAGLGDPYWYEWFVGLTYVVEMLGAASSIVSVTIQATEFKGLDDVIVRFKDGIRRLIQVKHTRACLPLSFADLIDQDAPVLKRMAESWWDAESSGTSSEPYLMTNRSATTRERALGSAGEQQPEVSQVWPALQDFRPELEQSVAKATAWDDVKMPEKWAVAWHRWASALDGIPDDGQKLIFLRRLKIKWDQPELTELGEELRGAIGSVFGVSAEQATPLFNALCANLIKWTTSHRNHHEITAEEVYQALSLPPSAEQHGEHSLPPPEPFFESRKDIVEELSRTLLYRKSPVVFLTGDPGSGKTSIVSHLANRREPVVDLRFYAYRPISPEMDALPYDSDNTVQKRALWGDLLAQLRALLTGRLARYRVPVRNDLLNPSQLQSWVIELAQKLSEERQRRTVIAIDGIDHAARSGQPSNFLMSLLSPEQVPEGLCFLISGQPAAAYPQYPWWLTGDHPGVTKFSVPAVGKGDVAAVVRSAKAIWVTSVKEAVITAIEERAKGNTLATVFAAHELNSCSSLTAFLKRLDQRGLSDGVSAYYENIWRFAVGKQRNVSIGYRLASCIALGPERLTGRFLRDVFPDQVMSVADWTEVLRSLKPLLQESLNGFELTHNDVRVHLTRQMEGDPARVSEVASALADYYLGQPENASAKHAGIVRLLARCGRETQFADVYTPRYVAEGWAVGRPFSELAEHAREAIFAASTKRDWASLSTAMCGVRTLKQLRDSIRWCDHQAEEPPWAPPALPRSLLASECRVLPRNAWDRRVVSQVLGDAWKLVAANHRDRAAGLLRRWFSDILPDDLSGLASDRPIPDQQRDEGLEDLCELWGRICQHTGFGSRNSRAGNRKSGRPTAAFWAGFISESVRLGGPLRWARSLRRAHPVFLSTLEECITLLADKERWGEVEEGLRFLADDAKRFSQDFRFKAAVWSLFSRRRHLVDAWASPVVDVMPVRENRFRADEIGALARACFVRGWSYPDKNPGTIGQEVVEAYFKIYSDNRKRQNVSILFRAAASAGRFWGLHSRSGKAAENLVCFSEIAQTLVSLQKVEAAQVVALPHGYQALSADVFGTVLHFVVKVGGPFVQETALLLESLQPAFPFSPVLEQRWRFLVRCRRLTVPRTEAQSWIGSNGSVWKMKVGDRVQLLPRLIRLSRDVGLTALADEAETRFKWSWISYTDHKEYSLYDVAPWFSSLAKSDPNCWKDEGLRLLAISRYVDRSGDNEASSTVDRSLVESAASCGVGALWTLLQQHIDGSSEPAIDPNTTFISAVITSFERESNPRQDLRLLWPLSVGLLPWQDRNDRASLSRILDRISALCARRRSGAVQELEKLSPIEASLRMTEDVRVKPERGGKGLQNVVAEWPDLSDKLSFLESEIRRDPEGSRSEIHTVLATVARSMPNLNPLDLGPTLETILRILRFRRNAFSWEFDGSEGVYEEVLPWLTDQQLWYILDFEVRALEAQELDIWLEAVTDNIGLILLKRAESRGPGDLRQGLRSLLEMHEFWIEADGHLPALPRPLVAAQLDIPNPENLLELVCFSLLARLCSSSSLTVQSAIRGLWLLMQLLPEQCALAVEKGCGGLDDIGKARLMLLLEKLAAENPSAFLPLKPFVEKCHAGPDLQLTVSAWIALSNYSRVSGSTNPRLIPEAKCATQYSRNVLIRRPGGLPALPDTPLGHLRFVGGIRSASSLIEKLKIVTGDDLTELEQELMTLLASTPKGRQTAEKPDRHGDMIIPQSPELDLARRLLRRELAAGRWGNVSPRALAQAIGYIDDPFILLAPIRPVPVSDDWPVDQQLTQCLFSVENPAKTELRVFTEQLKQGLSEEQEIIAGVINSYDQHYDVRVFLQHYFRPRPGDLSPVKIDYALNGHTFFCYYSDRFEPAPRSSVVWMTRIAGGLGIFIDQEAILYPSSCWHTVLGWAPDPANPTVWRKAGRKVAWLEILAGPYRDEVWDPYYRRQPIIQRWICTRTAIEEARKLVPSPLIEHVFWEKDPFRREDDD